GNLIALFAARRIQIANRRLGQNAIVSIEDVSRIAHDVDRKRLLVDEHILESNLPEMQSIEGKISQVDADLSRVASAYEPLSTFPPKNEPWQTFWAAFVPTRGPIQLVLDLSRSNRDAEARAAMEPLEERFETINQLSERLISVNKTEADHAVAEIQG